MGQIGPECSPLAKLCSSRVKYQSDILILILILKTKFVGKILQNKTQFPEYL